jgi:hypothetical protein
MRRSMTSTSPLPRSWPAVAHVFLCSEGTFPGKVARIWARFVREYEKRIRLLSHSIRIEVQMSMGLSIDKLREG